MKHPVVRITVWAVAVAIAGWLALCATLFVSRRRLVYHPAPTRIHAAATDVAIDRGGVVLRGWLVHGSQPDAIVDFGGNAEPRSPMRDHLRGSFPRHALYFVAYRGYGASNGMPSEAAIVDDARAVFDAAHARHRCGTVDVIGRSPGAAVAAWLASQPAVDRLVPVTPFDEFATLAQAHLPWAPACWLLRERYDAAGLADRLRLPVLVAIAGRDAIVPATSTRALIDALPRQPRLVTVDDATHDHIVAAPALQRALQGFIGPPTAGCAAAAIPPRSGKQRRTRSAARNTRRHRQRAGGATGCRR